MDAVIGYNDPSAIGAVIAARSLGKKLTVVGLNGTSDGIAAVKDGRLVATVRSESVSIGQELVKGAYLLATKQKLPAKVVVVRPNLVTKANVNKLRELGRPAESDQVVEHPGGEPRTTVRGRHRKTTASAYRVSRDDAVSPPSTSRAVGVRVARAPGAERRLVGRADARMFSSVSNPLDP